MVEIDPMEELVKETEDLGLYDDVLSPYAPVGGWHPDDFPKLSVVMIPYSTNSGVRADPSITIIPEGWMFIEMANVRMAIPDRIEWAKLVHMGERLWNSHEQRVEPDEQQDHEDDDPSPTPP